MHRNLKKKKRMELVIGLVMHSSFKIPYQFSIFSRKYGISKLSIGNLIWNGILHTITPDYYLQSTGSVLTAIYNYCCT